MSPDRRRPKNSTLIEAGALVSASSVLSLGLTPLEYASKNGNSAIVGLLLAAGDSVDAAASWRAAAEGDTAPIIALLAERAGLDADHASRYTRVHETAATGPATRLSVLLAAAAAGVALFPQ